MNPKLPEKIGVIGVGLIGASIALGLKKTLEPKIRILGLCNEVKRAHLAQKAGIIDEIIDLNRKLPQDCTLIIICTPINTIIPTVKMLIPVLPPSSLIIDVASTKQVIYRDIIKFLPDNFSFIGTHPVAGREKTGFENASPDLFINKPWIICPTDKHSSSQIDIIKELIQSLGAIPFILDPQTHDRLVSWTSHLSLLMTSILIKTAFQQKEWPKISQIASTGFRDTTRLASDNPLMKRDIVLTNQKNVFLVLKAVKKEIDDFISLVKQDKPIELLKYFQQAKDIRDEYS